MVGGQAIDLQAAGAGTGQPAAPLTFEALRDMHARKTGALIRASAVSGAIMAGAVDAAVEAVRDYAVGLGLAFQIVDDILDVEGASEDLGKTVGKDAAAGKLTFPALLGLDASRRRARECAARAHAALAQAGLDTGYLGDIVDWVVSRTK